MMPNKRNPDPAEMVRGRAARAIGALTSMLTILKGLPLTYQRDLQEDKPLLFDTVEILESSLGVMAGLVETLSVDAARMRAATDQGYTTATAVADALVGRGVAFRSAHHVVGALVAAAEARGVGLDEVSDMEITAALAGSDDAVVAFLASSTSDPALGALIRSAASVEGALAASDVIGGTAPARVRAAVTAARERLAP
ncbi:MAG: argininosuccinate lyase [Chloroflexi bacterium]|nr:argininosuccinate lyase [Chloroflexota bacterium]